MAGTVDGSIRTSSIEQVVAPISTHLCYLKLLSEKEEYLEEFTQLEAAAHAVAKTSKNMAAVASRVMAGSDDDVMKMEMGPLLEALMMSGQHVLLATQKLSIEPDAAEHREELVEATQNVLLGVVKILLVEDDATVRKICAAAQWLLDCLTQVGAAADTRSLLKAFQVYSKAMLLLHNLVAERIQDLRDHRQQEHVKASMETLRRCISMLHTAMYTTIKHPSSEEAQDARRYILHQVDATVNGIIATLKSDCEYVSPGWCGYYTERRNRLLRLMSDADTTSLKEGHFDVVLRDLVFHGIAVANSSRREIRSRVTAKCKIVLQFWSEISRLCSSDKQTAKEHLENLRVSLMKQIHKLDEAVVKASLYQVTDIFAVTSGPLEQLVNAALSIPETNGGLEPDPLEPLSKAFISHADRMAEVAGFVSALANDEKSLESVENSRACLMCLRDGVTQLVLELGGDSVQYQGALHQLIEVQQKWLEEKEQLLNAFSDVINVKDFVSLIVEEMKGDLDNSAEAHREQDPCLLGKHISRLIGRMSQAIQIARRHVDKSDDPIYRNGLLVLVRQAEGSAAELTAMFTTLLDEEEFSLLAGTASEAIKNFEVLLEGLDGLQHPHLLSPLRDDARLPATSPPVTGPTNDQANEEHLVHEDEKQDLVPKLTAELLEKEEPEPVAVSHAEKIEERMETLIADSQPFQTPQNIDLLPLLCEVVGMTKSKDIEALNTACTEVVELSSCYTQATKEAASIVDAAANNEMESLRSELVALTPLLVQMAQETAMSSAKSTDAVFRHSTQFSDLIKTTRKILLPVTGMWYHAIQAMAHSHAPNTADACIQELGEVICLCADTVQLVTSTEIKVTGDLPHESITSLLNKLQKAQTNTKILTDLLGAKQPRPDDLDGPCILWALSVQVLLSSLDKVLGTGTTHGKEQLQSRHQMTPKKWLAAMSENSLRIQEAARLSSLNCRDGYKVKLLREFRDGVKTLTEAYLQTAEDLGTVPRSGVLTLARAELLQRQLQAKMRALSGLLSKVNEEYATAIVNTLSLASSVIRKEDSVEAEEARKEFEATAELLLCNVKTATESVQDCFNFIRDPRERSGLRFINDHLLFQMSEIVSRARLMVETRTIFETLSLDIQTQCWSAKAHYLVAELYKVDGILQVTKEQVKLGLQGKESRGSLETACSLHQETKINSQAIAGQANPEKLHPVDRKEPTTVNAYRTINPEELDSNSGSVNMACLCITQVPLSQRKSPGMPVFSSVDPALTYTSLFLKREAEKWDVHGNQIVKVTKEMADRIYHMTQYLKRKGPIQVRQLPEKVRNERGEQVWFTVFPFHFQSKDDFVTSAKDVVSSCQSITEFVRVIADHCLDQHCTKELSIIGEQIVTITNQLTIISSVNAVTPGCKSSDEILVKNAQNLLQTVIQGVRAAETACIKGLRQPEPNSEAAKAASLCFQWKKTLLIHRAQEQLSPDTDDLGLRKTSLRPAAPSLVPSISVLETHK
ncbi:hypothetical protein NFI96_022227 [Prochilodus magdalenae]|nr:hypothetical protein NFI96_022227 [Prochilodus magdalenae]